ncbi:unnamed protein product, partial [Laminaria digitata]
MVVVVVVVEEVISTGGQRWCLRLAPLPGCRRGPTSGRGGGSCAGSLPRPSLLGFLRWVKGDGVRCFVVSWLGLAGLAGFHSSEKVGGKKSGLILFLTRPFLRESSRSALSRPA